MASIRDTDGTGLLMPTHDDGGGDSEAYENQLADSITAARDAIREGQQAVHALTTGAARHTDYADTSAGSDVLAFLEDAARGLRAAEALTPRRAGERRTADPEDEWTVDLAEQVLRLAQPGGSRLLRALIDEGGTATVARLKELTDSAMVNHMQLTLNSAARKLTNGGCGLHKGRHLVYSRRDPDHPRKATVHDYVLPDHLVPIFDQALRRLGR